MSSAEKASAAVKENAFAQDRPQETNWGPLTTSTETTMPTDKERLDFLEKMSKQSRTGISFDWIPSVEGEASGYRMMRHHLIGQTRGDIRASIDAAMTNANK